MPPVPSTPTAVDALAERKRILDDNALLIQRRDKLREACGYYDAALAAVKEELEARHGADLTRDEISAVIDRAMATKEAEHQARFDDLVRREQTISSSVTELERKRLALGTTIEKNRKEVAKIDQEREEAIETHNKVLKRIHAERDHAQNEHAQAVGLFVAKRKEMAQAEADFTARERDLVERERKAAQKGRDLAIYEDRIRKAAAALPEPMPVRL